MLAARNPVTRVRPGQEPFQAHVELLKLFLAHRDAVVERIQGLLNAQQKPAWFLQDRAQLGRLFEDCFFQLPAVARDQAALRGRLQRAHWASSFKPRDMPGIPNEMFDPADLITRAFTLWQHTRWPGRNGRLRFANTLFNLYVIRCAALLEMRLWDEGADGAGERLALVQGLLDALWKTSPRDQPVLVRDARWLVPVAQSPTTDDLGPYFEVAEQIATSLADEDRLEMQLAVVVMAGGHLRSQLRHFTMQGTALDDHGLLLGTRRSNALDCAMLVQCLVPLLAAYGRAVERGDQRRRLRLGGAICQGLSADPDLFVNRLELLAAYTMIEHLFVTGDGAELTSMGARHVGLMREYAGLIARLAGALAEDLPQFRPVAGTYSPYGVMFGFSSNLLEHMTMKALQPEAETRFSLEDVFCGSDNGVERLAWVSGWRKLPHVSAEVQRLYEYPQSFAEAVFARIEHAFAAKHSGGDAAPVSPGRLHVATEDGAPGMASAGIPDLPAHYILSSDDTLSAAGRARACEQSRLLLDRNEGEYLVSWQGAGGWTAITKDVLTDVLGAGRSARVMVPSGAAAVMQLMGAGLVERV
jgi:hypothetical protein